MGALYVLTFANIFLLWVWNTVLTGNSIDNMRFALNWCLFGTAASTHEPSSIAACDEACQPTKRSLDVNSENSTTPTPYGYCEDLDRIAFTNCAMCYAQVSDHAYLSNCKFYEFSSSFPLIDTVTNPNSPQLQSSEF